MTHEETSLQTKKSLSTALKHQMEKKPLRKITVNDIITDCGLNRKTFYYHFEDIYDLLKWTLEQDAFEVVRQFDLTLNAEDALRFVMDYVESNSHLLNCAYDSIGRDEMKRFFCDDFTQISRNLIDQTEQENDLHLPEPFKRFLNDFYTHALAGMLVDWFHTRHTPAEKQAMVKNFSFIFRVILPEVLKQADSSNFLLSSPSFDSGTTHPPRSVF